MHPLVPAGTPLDQLDGPPAGLPAGTVRDYSAVSGSLPNFVNERRNWLGHPGQGFFSARIELPEPMRLEVLMGYDGPFRLWIDGEPFYTDMNGLNPCLPDEYARRTALAAGSHRLDVGMDTNNGQAWGFFLRLLRLDVPKSRIAAKDYAVPEYHAA